MSDEDPIVVVLRQLAEKAREAREAPPVARPDEDGWRPSGLLIALGDLVDDEECLEERDAWPDFPAR